MARYLSSGIFPDEFPAVRPRQTPVTVRQAIPEPPLEHSTVGADQLPMPVSSPPSEFSSKPCVNVIVEEGS